jgi:tetratricopeptide (TPR) repeat protein
LDNFEKIRDELARKFCSAAKRAIEEFKIINNYAPNAPWVHEQMAYSYRDLKMPIEEIQAYEMILLLNPTEVEILFKLGVLYFQLGRNADGLRIYEQLRKLHASKGENLITHYGSYSVVEESYW